MVTTCFMNDRELLTAWTSEKSEAAFTELVRRHLDLVYGSALRQVREPELARDVSQAVFLILAQKAASLETEVLLPAWLFRTTRFVATRALRTELRRHHREHENFEMNPTSIPPSAIPESWVELESHLDAAIAALPAVDRDVVLLRYFERQPLREVGKRLDITEDAAKKRLQRAIGKMRRFFGRRGAVLTATGLAGLLADLPVQSAPPDLAAIICRSALSPASAPVAGLVSAGARDWLWMSLRNALTWVVVGLMLTGAGGWILSRSSAGRHSTEAIFHPANTAPSPSSAAEAATAAALPGTSRLQMDVRSAVTGRPLRASLLVNLRRDGELQREWELVTDDAGIAEIPVRVTSANVLQVWVSAAGYVPVVGTWQGHEFVEPLLLESFRLDPGTALQGTTVNEAHQPVPGALVCLNTAFHNPSRRQNVAFHRRLNAMTTDASGKFHSDQLPSLLHHSLTLSVDHPDYAQATFPLDGPDALATNPAVTLRRGLWVRGRVVIGAEGLPAGNVPVVAERSPGGFVRQSVADDDGHFRVGPFFAGQVTLTLTPPGFAASKFNITLAPDQRELVLYLPSDPQTDNASPDTARTGHTVRLTGRVVDRNTGDPIPRFQVCLGEHSGSIVRLLGQASDGRFDWSVNMGSQAAFVLEIEAEGHGKASTEMRPVKEGVEEFLIQLDPGSQITGWVVNAQGEPVSGAFAGLNLPEQQISMLNGGRPGSGYGTPKTVTDREGRFSFPPTPNAESVLIVAPEGCSQVPVGKLGNRRIQLQKWGAIEGTWAPDGNPAAGQMLILQGWTPTDDRVPLGIQLDMNARTDGQGRFRFNRVPAGPADLMGLSVSQNRFGYSHRTRVDVPAGKTTEVILGNDGRSVVGVLRCFEAFPDHDWEADEVVLVGDVPEEPPMVNRAQQIWIREKQIGRYAAAMIGADGAFRFANVTGGRYRLEVQLRTPMTSAPEPGAYRILGHLTVPLSVPEVSGEEAGITPLDLGVLEIPLNGAPQPPR